VAATETLTPMKNHIASYEVLFKEGVTVAKKDVHMLKHPELADKNMPHLHLTNQCTQDLCDFLHLAPEVPATLCPSHPETGGPRPKGLESSASLTRGKADRDTCRQSTVPPAANKRAEAGTGSATEFQFTGGCGRGRGQPPP
uniref:Small ribosomal subunit protein eS10 n=1 Tax=Mustela putorius furo TaxID=9669 RepID=M3XS33_MUSPF